MPEERRAVKLDFTSGLEDLPERPRPDEQTREAALEAGREMGFYARTAAPPPATARRELPPPLPVPKLDGRRLRSRGANTQMNIKVTAAEKEMILLEAAELIQHPLSQVGSIGEFVVYAVELYRSLKSKGGPGSRE